MSDSIKEVNIQEIIAKTKEFDKPYAPAIPEGIHQVEIQSFERSKSKEKGYEMLTITVVDQLDRTARVTQMLELEWIEGTIRLVKGLFTHNSQEEDKESIKEKINKYFDEAKSGEDLQKRCVDILTKVVDKGCICWLRVERKNKDDKYPDKAISAYEPQFRWKTPEEAAATILTGGQEITTENVDSLFQA